MSALRFLLAALLLSANGALAQSQGEITFWETVRDSKNPAELRAYLQAYPSGVFKPIAEARLAALERGAPVAPRPVAPATAPAAPAAPAIASSAPSKVTNETRMPRAGDTWTYQLSYPRMRGQWGQQNRPPATHVVKIGEVAGGRIVDQLSIDGGTLRQAEHSGGAYLVPQGVSVFSPYLVAMRELPAQGSLGRVTILDPECSGRHACDASARVMGRETVQVPAGSFTAVKVVVDQSWRSSGSASGVAAGVGGMSGGRTLVVWYVPELKRAVKVQSRATVGDTPPIEPNFDLELLGYQVN